jgi:hypothetical protein
MPPNLSECPGLWAAGVLKGVIRLQAFVHVAADKQGVGGLSRVAGSQPPPNSFRSAFASWRSELSKPSENQP